MNSFGGGTAGFGPSAGVLVGKHGTIYGSTWIGGTGCGSEGCGLIYALNKSGSTWKESVLYEFSGGSDGANPSGRLVADEAGNLYGTAYRGGITGSCGGCGVVFELVNSGTQWKENVLYSFTGGSDGNYPGDGVIFDKTGNLYGTDFGAQSPSEGAVFELSPSSGSTWTETTLHTFAGGKDGAYPYCGLIFDKKGNLYGDTEGGAGGADGTVFELSPSSSGWKETVLALFDGGYHYGQGLSPIGNLAMDKSGNVYGATFAGGKGYCAYGGYHCGLVYELTSASTGYKEKVLYDFSGGSDGGVVRAGVVLNKGKLYGTTYEGGDKDPCYPIPGCGVVYKLTPSGSTWTESPIATFTRSSGATLGAFPIAELTLHNGKLFGSTYRGGYNSTCTSGCGTAFEVKP